MGRRRKSNPLDLPPHVRPKHGAFYYEHRNPRRWEHIGTDVATAKKRAAEIESGQNEGYGTVAYWLDQFTLYCWQRTKAPDPNQRLAKRTAEDYERDAVPLKAFFGAMHPSGLEPKHKAEYLDLCVELNRAVRGNREFSCLSSMMSWLARKGEAGVKANPFIKCGVKRNKETKRDRYVEHDEMRLALENAPVQVWALSNLVYRTLQRPEDIITWTMRNITERKDSEGRIVRILRNVQSKTGATVDIAVTPDIDAILARLRGGDGKLRGMTLIHRLDGLSYTYDGLCAMLKRRQKAAGVASFGFYDLKGKGATDMWLAGVPLEQIQALCGHESITTTEIYCKGRWRGVVQPNKVAVG